MRRIFRKAAVTGTSLTIAVAAVLMLGIATPAPAHAAVGGCFASGCTGLDPYNLNCGGRGGDAQTNFVSTKGDFLFNDYSPSCQANWAEGTLSQEQVSAGYSMYVYISTTDSNGQSESMCSPTPGGGGLHEYCTDTPYKGIDAWTDMVDGTNTTYAGMTVYDANGNVVNQLTLQE